MAFFSGQRGRLVLGLLLAVGLLGLYLLGPAPPAATPGRTPSPAITAPTPTAAGVVAAPTGPIATPPARNHVYLPTVAQQAPSSPVASPAPVVQAPPATPTAQSVTATPPKPTPTPTPRPAIRITKLGLGVYDSGGAMLPDLEASRPSVILLMDPTLDFARDLRRRFPKAFIVGRLYVKDQPLDNPTARGEVFADRVAASAVPLRCTVDAWMSYNEVADGSNKENLRNWNAFQVAFAQKLQGQYRISAVAGNDGPNSVSADDYAEYLKDAISLSDYFGVHVYPRKEVRSLRDPAASYATLAYQQIHQALEKKGVKKPGPYIIITELGLWDGWKGVTSDEEMAADFRWYGDRIRQDPYVLGATVYGLFLPGRWEGFNIAGSAIPRRLGEYNSVPGGAPTPEPALPPPPAPRREGCPPL